MGAPSLFIVDDNITLNLRRFEALCQAIIDAGLNDLEYILEEDLQFPQSLTQEPRARERAEIGECDAQELCGPPLGRPHTVIELPSSRCMFAVSEAGLAQPLEEFSLKICCRNSQG
jgi:hypothetical protein